MLIDKNYYNLLWYFVFILNDNDFNVFLFLTIIMVYLNNYNSLKKINLIFLYWVMINCIKQNFYKISSIPELENFVLYNGLVMIHPIFIYLFYFTWFFIIFKKIKIKNQLKNNFLIGLFTLVLGSWWAQQEINWGGWWNWDVVEVVLWILLLKSLIINHVWLKKIKYILINYTLSNLFVYIFIFFIFIRLDVIDSVHVFNSFDMIDLNFWFFDHLVSFFLLYVMFFFINFLNFYTHKKKQFYNKVVFVGVFVNFLSLYYIIIYTWFIFSTMWFDTDISEFVNYLKHGQNIFLFLVLFLFFTKRMYKPSFLLVLVYLNYFLINFFFFVKSFLRLKRYKNIHLNIILFIYLLFFYYYFDYISICDDFLQIKNYSEFFDSLSLFFLYNTFNTDVIFYQLFNFDFLLEVGYIELPFFILSSNHINFALLTLFEQDFFLWLNPFIFIFIWWWVFNVFMLIKNFHFSAIKINI